MKYVLMLSLLLSACGQQPVIVTNDKTITDTDLALLILEEPSATNNIIRGIIREELRMYRESNKCGQK